MDGCICFALPSFTFVCLCFDAKKIKTNTFKARKIGKEVEQRRSYIYSREASQPVVMLRKMSPKFAVPSAMSSVGANSILLWNGPSVAPQTFLFPKKIGPKDTRGMETKHTKTNFRRIIAQCKMMEVDSGNVRASHLQAPLLVAVCACGFSWNPEAYACVG